METPAASFRFEDIFDPAEYLHLGAAPAPAGRRAPAFRGDQAMITMTGDEDSLED